VRRFLAIFVLGVVGCGGAQRPDLHPLVAEDRRPESRALPVDARSEPLPADTPLDLPEGYVMPVDRGECIPEAGFELPASDEPQVVPGPCPEHSGIFVSESRANRDAIYRIRYTELRRTYESDRRVWAAHRDLYEAQVAADREEISRLQPSWWERHDGTILTAVGVVVGAAVTVAITFAVNQVSE